MILAEQMQAGLRSGRIVPRWLVWLSARNTATGQVETVGFWTGDDDADFEIDGEERRYHGAGSLISIGDMTYTAGGEVQMQRLTLAILAPEVEQAIRQYDPRLQPAEIHLALFDPDTGALIGTARAFRGWIEEAPIRRAAKGDQATSTCTVTLASSARAGTKTLGLKKSAQSQRRRLSTDRGRDYADIAGQVNVQWGGEDENGYFVRLG